MKIEREIDLHGHTRAEALALLEDLWSTRSWHGLQVVRVIHGTGAILWRVTRQWADEKAIPWSLESGNAGVTLLYPGKRLAHDSPVVHTPLAPIRHKTPLIPTKPEARPSVADEDLMAEEFARLAEEPPNPEQQIHSPFRSLESLRAELERQEASRPQLQLRPPKPKPGKPKKGQKDEVDLMAAEFSRLGQGEKHPSRQHKGPVKVVRAVPEPVSPPRVVDAPDPMAAEFERLADEDTDRIRRRKGG